MEESKWIKFSQKLPTNEWYIWVYMTKTGMIGFVHAKGVEIGTCINEGNMWKDACIKMPSPPEKEVHWCPDSLLNPRLICTQNILGHLIIQTHNERGDRYVLGVKCCPFCGFTPEEK